MDPITLIILMIALWALVGIAIHYFLESASFGAKVITGVAAIVTLVLLVDFLLAYVPKWFH